MAVVQREEWVVHSTDRGHWHEVPVPCGAAWCVEDSHIVLQLEPGMLAGGRAEGVLKHQRSMSGRSQGTFRETSTYRNLGAW